MYIYLYINITMSSFTGLCKMIESSHLLLYLNIEALYLTVSNGVVFFSKNGGRDQSIPSRPKNGYVFRDLETGK